MKYIYFILLFIISMITRLILKKYLDNTVIYTNVIVLLTQSLIAIAMFSFIKKLKFKIKSEKTLKIISNLDKTSFYVYIVHYVFCVGPLDIVKSFGKMYFIQVILTLIISYIIAQVLVKLTDCISKILMKEE